MEVTLTILVSLGLLGWGGFLIAERIETKRRRKASAEFGKRYYPDEMAVAATVCAVIAEELGVAVSQLHPKRRLQEDLGVDEPAEWEGIRLSLNEELGLTIPPNLLLNSVDTVAELVELVSSEMALSGSRRE